MQLHRRPVVLPLSLWRAMHDTTGRLRFPAGPDAVRLAEAK
ncbi:hypothetical protein [Streptomyces sp. NPDC059262]